MTNSEKKLEKIKRTLIAISIGLFLFSLGKKCYCTTNQCADSILVFLIGWLGLIFGGAALTWLANPFLIFTWILTNKNSKYALATSFVASLLSLSFLLFDNVIDNEAGHYNKIISYQLGYWLWLSSSVTMFLGNLVLRFNIIRNFS